MKHSWKHWADSSMLWEPRKDSALSLMNNDTCSEEILGEKCRAARFFSHFWRLLSAARGSSSGFEVVVQDSRQELTAIAGCSPTHTGGPWSDVEKSWLKIDPLKLELGFCLQNASWLCVLWSKSLIQEAWTLGRTSLRKHLVQSSCSSWETKTAHWKMGLDSFVFPT